MKIPEVFMEIHGKCTDGQSGILTSYHYSCFECPKAKETNDSSGNWPMSNSF
jgi:hypothetical protein